MSVSKEPGSVIALVGNPNVGKSTVFNALTNLRQHTGNWPGKTVETARGAYTYHGKNYTLVDLPGAYSLRPGSAEEEVTRDYLLSGEAAPCRRSAVPAGPAGTSGRKIPPHSAGRSGLWPSDNTSPLAARR